MLCSHVDAGRRGPPGGPLGVQGSGVHRLAGGRAKAVEACIMLWLVSLLNSFFTGKSHLPSNYLPL